MSASLASLVVSLIAVSVALITLWKTHFARFNPLTASGERDGSHLRFFIAEERSEGVTPIG
jgi:hypothetical protein